MNKVLLMPTMTLEFRRDFCLEDAIRHSKKLKFDPQKQLKVYKSIIIIIIMVKCA